MPGSRVVCIILAQMNTFRSHSFGHIHTVVDEERNVVFPSNFMELVCCFDQSGRVGIFVSVLNTGDSTLNGCFYYFYQIPIPEDGWCGICD